jgi:hypothetical protein
MNSGCGGSDEKAVIPTGTIEAPKKDPIAVPMGGMKIPAKPQ